MLDVLLQAGSPDVLPRIALALLEALQVRGCVCVLCSCACCVCAVCLLCVLLQAGSPGRCHALHLPWGEASSLVCVLQRCVTAPLTHRHYSFAIAVTG